MTNIIGISKHLKINLIFFKGMKCSDRPCHSGTCTDMGTRGFSCACDAKHTGVTCNKGIIAMIIVDQGLLLLYNQID